jgi:hypothetical protein
MKDHATSGFPAKKDRAAAFLASGLTARATAAKVRVSERTISVWRDDPEFVRLIALYQTRLISRSLGKLAGAASKAVQTLSACLESGDGDGVRVRAAVAILDQLIRVREIVNIEERLRELEKRTPKCR